MAVCDIVVLGSYPPMPGPGTASTLGAVRRAWAQGSSVAMVGYRTGAAPMAVPVTGALAGWRLEQVRRHFGGPAEICIGVQQAVPFSDRRLGATWATALGLMMAMKRFGRATVVMGEDPDVGKTAVRLLARGGARFSVADEALAERLVQHYGLDAAAVAFEPVAPFPSARPDHAATSIPDRGLYAPGAGQPLTYVELPSTTAAQRARARLDRMAPAPLRRFLRRR